MRIFMQEFIQTHKDATVALTLIAIHMILPNVFQAVMKQGYSLLLPFNIPAFSDWPFPDRPAARLFLIPLYGFVILPFLPLAR